MVCELSVASRMTSETGGKAGIGKLGLAAFMYSNNRFESVGMSSSSSCWAVASEFNHSENSYGSVGGLLANGWRGIGGIGENDGVDNVYGETGGRGGARRGWQAAVNTRIVD